MKTLDFFLAASANIASIIAPVLAAHPAPAQEWPARPMTMVVPFAWKHLRTTNVIESSFATVRHRTVLQGVSLEQDRARHDLQAGRGRREKLASCLDGHNQLPKVILGVRFTDEIEVARSQAQVAA